MEERNDPKKVLLVEDDPFLIDIYSSKLKESGFIVSVVEDGERALQKIKEETPDLVVLDIVLPKTDGWEIMREIKKDKKLNSLKVVILSNLGQKGEIEKGLEMGAQKYLIKAHYTPSEIVNQIKEVFEKNG